MPQHNARKRIRAYLAAVTRMSGERIATYGAHTLTVPDLQELLRSERAARRRAKEQEAQVRHLRDKNATYVQRLKDWDALSPATLSTWKALQAGRDSLRESLQRAEDQIRTQAGTIEQQDAKVRALTAERDREKAHATRLAKKVEEARAGKPEEPPLLAEQFLSALEKLTDAYRTGK